MLFPNVLERIGNTPLVEIGRLNPFAPDVRILAKVECVNPGGSIKDRVALAMIEAAEASGELVPGKTIIEATSGNTGIGLAMVAAVKGYAITLLMSETASEERRMILRAFGADILLTPGHLATDGAIELAYRMYREEPDKYVLLDQYNNPASIEAHYNGTGLEIWEQTRGEVTHVVSTLGTTGTCMGITRRMRKQSDTVRVVAVEPYAGHKIQGLKNMLESYPPGIWDRSAPDEILHVEDEMAFDLARRLAREEGLLAGMSSGAALGGALKVAEGLAARGEQGLIVAVFPDSGERYLSTPLFRSGGERGVRLHSLDSGAEKTVPFGEDAGVYTVGPSMDEPGGLDAWRRIVLADALARYLRAQGGGARLAVGLADLDDRALRAAREAGRKRDDFARERTGEIARLAGLLGVSDDAAFASASGCRDLCVGLVRKLMGKGLAYEKLRSVYFDVLRDKRYGTLASVDMDKVTAGRTVDLDAYVKDNPLDFTLLKRASLQDLKDGEVLETEWGNVRPSWFVQLAAAGASALPRLDVLIASEAHRFPHLENLRALLAAAGREPRVWMVDQQVAAEEGQGLDDLLARFGNARALRMWLLSGAYRKPLAASDEAVAMWTRNWQRAQEAAGTLSLVCAAHEGNGARANADGDIPSARAEQAVFDLKAAFAAAMEDDLSLHRFWPAFFRFGKEVAALASGEGPDGLSRADAALCRTELLRVDEVLGVIDHGALPLPEAELPVEVRELLARRVAARAAKDYAASDALRDDLAERGYRVEDGAHGVRVYRG
ncbi:MAG: cysteine synthase [Desulfovibrionaceae bacterium]